MHCSVYKSSTNLEVLIWQLVRFCWALQVTISTKTSAHLMKIVLPLARSFDYILNSESRCKIPKSVILPCDILILKIDPYLYPCSLGTVASSGGNGNGIWRRPHVHTNYAHIMQRHLGTWCSHKNCELCLVVNSDCCSLSTPAVLI